MTYSIYDYSNTNKLHRKALLDAINSVNLIGIKHQDIVVVVSTRNMIKIIPLVVWKRTRTILAIVGFGRLFSDYGLIGRLAFKLIVFFHDRTTAQAFIVEHDVDKAILQNSFVVQFLQLMEVALTPLGFHVSQSSIEKRCRLAT